MSEFFIRIPINGESEFDILTVEYFVTMLVCIILIGGFYFIAPKIKHLKREWLVRYLMGITMLLTSVTIFKYAYDNNHMWYKYLPEATCGWAIYFGGLSLLTKNRTLAVLTFFWGWGAISTILYPNLLEGPTRYNFYQFFLRHILILVSSIYMFRVLDFKLYKKDFYLYIIYTLPAVIVGGVISWIVNDPDELNMFYMLQPATNTPVFGVILEYNYILYVVLWLGFAILIGYVYGLPFYEKTKK